MNTNTADEGLAAALATTAECMGYTLSPAAATMMAKELADYPAAYVTHALRDCMRTVQGRLTLAAIIQRIQANDGHPSANEAWAIALEATDECTSVSLTPQIQQALSAAQPVLSTGDKIGARMAFLAAYERLLTHARAQRHVARWTFSVGFDAQARLPALEAAKSAGRLTYQPDPLLCLPPPLADSGETDHRQSGRAAALALLAEWKEEEKRQAQAKLRQRQRDLEECEQRRAQIVEQWQQKREERGHVSTGFKPNRSKYKKIKKKRVYG